MASQIMMTEIVSPSLPDKLSVWVESQGKQVPGQITQQAAFEYVLKVQQVIQIDLTTPQNRQTLYKHVPELALRPTVSFDLRDVE